MGGHEWDWDIFRRMMAIAIGASTDQVLTVITYLDEVMPGNVLNPDNARKSWAVYMSCLELPQWMLQLEDCWLAVAVIRTIASDHRKRKIYSGTIASDYVA